MTGKDRLAKQLTRRRPRNEPLEPLYGRMGVVTAAGGAGVTVDLGGVTAGPFSSVGTPGVGDTVFLVKKGDHYLVMAITP